MPQSTAPSLIASYIQHKLCIEFSAQMLFSTMCQMLVLFCFAIFGEIDNEGLQNEFLYSRLRLFQILGVHNNKKAKDPYVVINLQGLQN